MLKTIAIVTTAFALGASTFAIAGEGQGRPTKEERLNRMQQHLDLSEDQVSQIREIHRNGGGREELGAVLTESQRTQIRNHRKHREHSDRHGPDSMRPPVSDES